MTSGEFDPFRKRLPPGWVLDEDDATLFDEQDALVVHWPQDMAMFRALVADAIEATERAMNKED